MNPNHHQANAPSRPICFPNFPRLPPELRRKIWQMAICTDETPRIHYYSLFNTDKRGGRRQSFLQRMMRTYPPMPKRPHPRKQDGTLEKITHPRLLSYPSQQSWTEANRFLYLWDAGLQGACRESRAALLHHQHQLRQQHNHLDTSTTKRPTVKRYDMVVANCYQGQQINLEVRSNCDIICFQFSPEDMAACVSLRWDILLPRLPFFHLPHCPGMNLAFEFQDSWDEGLGMNRESVLKSLSEASHRGLVMRAFWAWQHGEIPRWTRMWLIDRSGRLPANYELSREGDDERYHHDAVYGAYRSEPKQHYVFTDGKNTYVESYTWEGQRYEYCRYFGDHPDVPILSFIWKTDRLFTPPCDEVYLNTRNIPLPWERFFRVLRQLPDANGTG